MITITNMYGNKIDYEAAINLMDDEIRELVHSVFSPCTEQRFFDIYCLLHRGKYNEDFELNKPNPCY